MTASQSKLAAQAHAPIDVIDAAPGGLVLIIGSLPPTGHDLDLAMRRCDVAAVVVALTRAGFIHLHNRYVCFSGGTAQVVDTTVLEDWDLPVEEIEALLKRARLLPGMSRVARPAPEHTLLLLAPLCARAGSLTVRRRTRLQVAVAEDPNAWQLAQKRAQAWGATRALDLLQHVAGSDKAPLTARIGALAQPRRDRGTRWLRATAGAVRRITPRPQRGAVVTFSGVDGAGKTSQAAALAAALEQLGEDPVIVWSRVRYDPLLASVGRTAKKLLSPFGMGGSGTVALDGPISPGNEQPSDLMFNDQVRSLTRAVDIAWAYLSGAIDGYRHLRLSVPAVVRGKIVICDRYTLDTHVHLMERFRSRPRTAAAAAWLDWRLSPRPLRSFWLDIAPDVAWARKPDNVHPDWLSEHDRLYRSLYASHDAIRLDTGESLETTASDVAERVTFALDQMRSRSTAFQRLLPTRPTRFDGVHGDG